MDMVEGKEFFIENGILKVYKGTGADVEIPGGEDSGLHGRCGEA